jgi:hypothetical protein
MSRQRHCRQHVHGRHRPHRFQPCSSPRAARLGRYLTTSERVIRDADNGPRPQHGSVAPVASPRCPVPAALVMTGAWVPAALPALADGGPHASATNGSSVLMPIAAPDTGPTAQGQFPINAASEEALCLTPRAQSAGGHDGRPDRVRTPAGRSTTSPVAPAPSCARNGGFDQARTVDSQRDSSRMEHAGRLGQPFRKGHRRHREGPTSAHLNLPRTRSALRRPGATVAITRSRPDGRPRAFRHNPHGNSSTASSTPCRSPRHPGRSRRSSCRRPSRTRPWAHPTSTGSIPSRTTRSSR